MVSLVVSTAMPVLLYPRETQAFLGIGDLSITIGDIPRTIMDTLKKAYKVVADVAFKNAIKYFMNKIAYDTATYIATGSSGQKPLFVSEGWGAYFKNVRDESYAKFFLDLSDEVWDKDLCDPLDPLVKIKTEVSVRNVLDPNRGQAPRCSWQEIKKNLNDVRKMSAEELVDFSYYFHPGGGSDIGAWLTISSGAEFQMREDLRQAELVRQIEGEYKSLTSPVSGQIKTPASTISKTLNDLIGKSSDPYLQYTGTAIADAIGVFTNTLTSKLLQRVFKKGFNPQADRTGTSFDLFGSSTLGNLAAAKLQFSDLIKPDYSVGGSIDVINQLSIECGTTEYGGEQFCQTIDLAFAQAIEQKLSLLEAIEQGLIKGDAPFGFLADGTEPSYRDGVPFRSILILRKYRIVPVGWELAAQYAKNFEIYINPNAVSIDEEETEGVKQLSLNYLISKYNDPSSNNPYYKLVDPDWILKAPETVCMRQGPGEDIIDETFVCDKDTSGDGNIVCPPDEASVYITRRTYCADERSCIVESDDGSCEFFGYCVEEKPIWRIAGDECSAIYNTCQTFVYPDGSRVSYLENTLEPCQKPGCKAYCQDLNPEEDEWLCTDTNYDLSFYTSSSSQDRTCSAKEEGCTTLERTANFDLPVNLRIAPDESYPAEYDCIGYNIQVEAEDKADCETDHHFWREDLEICVESGNKYCKNFALYCLAEDENCRLYTPLSIDAPAVPAVLDEEADLCPADCVGYRDYYMAATEFEEAEEVSFIASAATSCNTPGCDEFTNLDEVARGGEGLEYFSFLRQCVDTDDSSKNIKTFYTWEGSDTAGYQLRKWQLEAAGNAPIGNACDSTSDCRNFYNPDSNSYHEIDFASVIFASQDCHPYRRTLDSEVYYGIPAYSIRCNAANAGCRLYKDNSSYNYQVVLADDFEDGESSDWTGGSSSNESVRRGGQSLKISGSAYHLLAEGDYIAGDSYAVTLLVKGSGTLDFSLAADDGSSQLVRKSVELNNEWQLHNIDMGQFPSGTHTQPAFSFNASATAYVDYVILKRINNILVIKDSWSDSSICSGFEGCELYEDDLGQKVAVHQFSDLCLETVVGCEEFRTLDDEPIYLVYDKQKECSQVGCRRLGELKRNKFTPDATYAYEFVDRFLVVKEEIDVCQSDQEGCTAFEAPDMGGLFYYKDPGERICEFKDGEWWLVGEDDWKCPGTIGFSENMVKGMNDEMRCLGGRAFDNSVANICSADRDCLNYYDFSEPGKCTGFAALCPSTESGCQEYQDPTSPDQCDEDLLPRQFSNESQSYAEDQTPACDFYWYKNAETCGENEGIEDGCVRFVDTSKEN